MKKSDFLSVFVANAAQQLIADAARIGTSQYDEYVSIVIQIAEEFAEAIDKRGGFSDSESRETESTNLRETFIKDGVNFIEATLKSEGPMRNSMLVEHLRNQFSISEKVATSIITNAYMKGTIEKGSDRLIHLK